MSYYQNLIKEIAPDANPRHVEAWLRVEHGTLDQLSRQRFTREVELALQCIAEAGADVSDALAKSYGLCGAEISLETVA
jgi:hypothetical protein